MEKPTRTIDFFEDGYDIEECTRVCYDLGCSYLSFVYEPIFHQISNRLHLIPKKCNLYNGTVTLTPKVSSDLLKNEIFCKSTIPGTILYFNNHTTIFEWIWYNDHLLFHLIYIYQRYLNFVDEYPCRQPLSLKSEFNITLDNITCDKRTFEWYKRNNSDEDVDDGVRYNKGCKMSYECGEGACLTNNTETCLNKDESPKFTCELSKIIITTTQYFLSRLMWSFVTKHICIFLIETFVKLQLKNNFIVARDKNPFSKHHHHLLKKSRCTDKYAINNRIYSFCTVGVL